MEGVEVEVSQGPLAQLLDRCPLVGGVPHRWWLTMENTLLMDGNSTKSILSPLSIVIFPGTWIGNKNDAFIVNELAP